VIGLSRSSYYYQKRNRQPTLSDEGLRDRIEAIHRELPSYGYRRIVEELSRSGIAVNSKRVRRVMNAYDLRPTYWKRFVRTTESNHELPVYPNLLKSCRVDGLNQAWVADITYIAIRNGFVYLAAILDLYSRRVIGWAISKRLDRQLCLAALRMALDQRGPVQGCIHHSDRGVQYASRDYSAVLKAYGLQISMAARGNPFENAHMESFYKTLKYEEVHLWNYDTYQDVIERIPYFLEQVYNRKRLHSALGYVPPAEFEAAFIRQSNAGSPVQQPL